MTHHCLSLPGWKQPCQIIRERREARCDLALALLRLEQLVRDVQRRQNRGLVRFHDRPQRQHLLQRLVHVRGHFTRILGRQVRPDGVFLPADHHPNRMLLGAHADVPPPATPPRPVTPSAAAAVPPPVRPLPLVRPLPTVSRACSSRNANRDSRSCTRTRAASRNVQCQATLRYPSGIPGPRYSSNTSSRSSRLPAARRRTSDTWAALTPGGSKSARSRSTGGCGGSGR